MTGSREQRPPSNRIIFCDGSADTTFRDGIDLELSHWIPNRTPAQFKADTSTEICMRFASDRVRFEEFDLAVNNHVDVDGVLSLFVMADSDFALSHRTIIVQAAEMGDFWAWADPPAQVLYETLALEIARLKSRKSDPQEMYAACFGLARSVLAGAAESSPLEGVTELGKSRMLIDRGEVGRVQINSRFTHYSIPRELAEKSLEKALSVPAFCVSLTRQGLLHPQARARLDGERIQLISIETRRGWYYDLWYPGYVWAETPNRWHPPGIAQAGITNSHQFGFAPLSRAIAELQREEGGPGRWVSADSFSPFTSLKGRSFPVVASVTKAGKPVPSTLSPAVVAGRLASAFEGA